MEVAMFDTYVKKIEGGIMHFDVIVPTGTEPRQVYLYGQEYLKRKGQEGQELSAKECKFSHIEQLAEYMELDIHENGFYILEMQGC